MMLQNVKVSFFYYYVLFCCGDVPLVFYLSSADGHLGYFQHLAIVTSTAINTEVHIFLYWYFGMLGVYSQKRNCCVKMDFHF